MKQAKFVHLHKHSQYSLLDGACWLDGMLEMAHEFGMPALVFTDHGNMFDAIEFYTKDGFDLEQVSAGLWCTCRHQSS